MILGDLEFKAEDFLGIDMSYQNDERIGSRFGLTTVQASRVAEAANRLLRERLEKAPETECDGDPRLDPDSYEGCAPRFTARLVCVEKISK